MLLLALGCSERFSSIFREPAAVFETELPVDSEYSGPPRLLDVWEGRAEFVPDSGPYGGDFAMHFPSLVWDAGRLQSFFIENLVVDGENRSRVGRASSSDGVAFAYEGTALDLGGAWQWTWPSLELSHGIGREDNGGWSANTTDDAAGHLVFGPYVDDLAPGPMTVSWQLMVDNNTADSLAVLSLDVFDVTTQTVLASRELLRTDFEGTWEYEVFNLDYEQAAGHSVEFRVYWVATSYVRVGTVAVSQGQAPFHDDRLASFPGVWKDQDGWAMVYECAGTDPSWPGDVCAATSDDGVVWVKHAANPVLRHQGGFESVNIGTPSLSRDAEGWTVYFHGFDGQAVQLGVAEGAELDALVRRDGVVLETGTGWDSGTVGRRSLHVEGDWTYMAYEGSTDPPFDVASWSSGLARSRDGESWEKCDCNPVLPQTGSGFGFDGPEWLVWPDGSLHLLYRSDDNQTLGASIRWK